MNSKADYIKKANPDILAAYYAAIRPAVDKKDRQLKSTSLKAYARDRMEWERFRDSQCLQLIIEAAQAKDLQEYGIILSEMQPPIKLSDH